MGSNRIALEEKTESFVTSVERAYESALVMQKLEILCEQMGQKSSYYPRGRSPECEALRRGLLRVGGEGGSTIETLATLYLAIETDASSAGRSNGDSAGRSDGTANHYFGNLRELKIELQSAPRERRVEILTRMQDLYAESGSDALVYFSALDSLAEGEFSHRTLYRAGDAAVRVGLAEECYETLRSLIAAGSHSPSLLAHVLRMGFLSKKSSSELAPYRELLEEEETVAELDFIRAVENQASARHEIAERQALSAYASAKNSDKRLSVAALEVAAEIVSATARGERSMLDRLDTILARILRCDQENHLAWNTLFDTEGLGCLDSGVVQLNTIETRLARYPSKYGYLKAAECAVEMKDDSRAENYMQRALEVGGRAVDTLVALAKLREDQGNFEEAKKLLEAAALRSPHHPNVAFTLEPSIAHSNPTSPVNMAKEVPIHKLSEQIRNQIQEAHLRGGSFRQALAATCTEYAFVAGLLGPNSHLYRNYKESRAQVGEYIQQIDQLLTRPTAATRSWRAVAGSMHQELNPAGYQAAIGHFRSVLRQLSGALASLDPDRDLFSSIYQFAELDQGAEAARDEWGKCAKIFEGRSPQEVVVSGLKRFKSSLQALDDILINQIGSRLLEGPVLLDVWIEAAEKSIVMQSLDTAKVRRTI